MSFSLKEIAQLLIFREAPEQANLEVRQLAEEKLDDIKNRLQELKVLRNELQPMLDLCTGSKDNCPIIAGLNDEFQ